MESIIAQYLMGIGYRFQRCGQWSEGWSCYDDDGKCLMKYGDSNQIKHGGFGSNRYVAISNEHVNTNELIVRHVLNEAGFENYRTENNVSMGTINKRDGMLKEMPFILILY